MLYANIIKITEVPTVRIFIVPSTSEISFLNKLIFENSFILPRGNKSFQNLKNVHNFNN